MLEKNKLPFTILLVAIVWCTIYSKFIYSNSIYVYSYKGWDIGSDTANSYYPFYQFISQKLDSFKSWSFSIGTGNSVYSLFLLLFDPFIILLYLTPKIALYNIILLISFFKTITIAIFAYYLLLIHVQKKDLLILLTLLYTFCSYVTVWGQHYFFQTGFLYFTLLMLGIEYFIVYNKKKLMLFGFFIIFAGSLYFSFYAIIFLLFYLPIRCFYFVRVENLRYKTICFILIVLYAAILASFSLFPVFDILNSSSRTNISFDFPFIYNLKTIIINISKFYSTILFGVNQYTGNNNIYEDFLLYTSVLFPVLCTSSIVYVFKNDNKFKYKMLILYILLLIPLIFPIVCSLFNKFSGNTTRYCFIYPYLECSIIMYIFKLKIFDRNSVLVGLVLNLIVWKIIIAYLAIATNLSVIIVYILIFTYSIGLIIYLKNKRLLFIILCIILELVIVNYNLVYAKRVTLTKSMVKNYDKTSQIVNQLNKIDDSFYRVHKNYLLEYFNDSAYNLYYGIDYYNSLPNEFYSKFRTSFPIKNGYYNELWKLPESSSVSSGMDENSYLYTFMNMKYFLSYKSNKIPFGYNKIFSVNDYLVLKNKYYLSNGIFFENKDCVSEKAFNQATYNQKIDLLYNKFVSNNCDHRHFSDITPIAIADIVSPNKYTITKVLNNKDAYYIFKFKNLESYLSLNIKNTGIKELSGRVFIKSDNEASFSDLNSKIIDQENVFLAYPRIKELRIDLPQSSVRPVFTLKKDNYKNYIEQINKLNKKAINLKYSRSNENEFYTKYLSGTDGVVVTSIPYDKYWKIIVNHKNITPQIVNIGFIGIPVKKGINDIHIYYKNDKSFLGIYISLTTCIVLLSCSLYILYFRKLKMN